MPLTCICGYQNKWEIRYDRIICTNCGVIIKMDLVRFDVSATNEWLKAKNQPMEIDPFYVKGEKNV